MGIFPGRVLPVPCQPSGTPSAAWIASIKGPALDDAKRCGSVCHCPGVRSDRILRMRNRHHAGAANETHSGFESDYTIRVTRTYDAAVRFAPQRHSGKVGRSGRARAGAGAARIAIEQGTGCWFDHRDQTSRWWIQRSGKFPHSERVVLPRMTAPPARKFSATVES